MGMVPPKIDSPKSFIGVGTREIIIVGIGTILAILVFVSPLSAIPKGGLIAFCILSSIYLAVTRHPVTGSTLEEHLLDVYRFYKRERFMQRGSDGTPAEHTELMDSFFQGQPVGDTHARDLQDKPMLFAIRPLDLKWESFLGILSFCFVVMLIVWAWTGGLNEVLMKIRTF